MLPSTGYFKGINCPFYDSGLCERPYCHFRHVKKEPQSIGNDGIESGEILQKLVSAAVQKVLQQTETVTSSPSLNVTDSEKYSGQTVSAKVTYNPTPIAELNKINHTDPENNDDSNEQKRRHIPVPYTPRKPASIAIKRPVDTNGSKLFTYLPPAQYNPGSETAQLDPYTPKGATESGEKYLPGSEKIIPEYKPKETQNSAVNYIPSDKAVSKKKILEYKPAKVKSIPSSVTYQPTPRSLVPCFSSDEDEPDIKKRKLSSDLNGLDDLGPEFDILDQILDEEKEVKNISQNDKSKESEKEVKNISQKDKIKESEEKLLNQKSTTKTIELVKTDTNRSEKDRSPKAVDKKSNNKLTERTEKSTERKEKSSDKSTVKKEKSRDKSIERKEKSSDKSIERREKSRDKSIERKEKCRDKSTERKEKVTDTDKQDRKSSRKSSHKSSDKDKNKHEKTNKSDKKSHSSSKHSRNPSKHSKQNNDTDKQNDNQHSKSHSRSKESRDKHKRSALKIMSDDDNHNYEDNLEDELNELSESDEESIALQCKKIFEEYVPTEKTPNTEECTEKFETDTDVEEYISTKKRISRTIDKNIKILPKAPIKPDFKVNAAQAMAERLAKVREFHALKSTSESNSCTNLVSKPESLKSIFNAPPPSTSSSKIRIAHVPYASTMLTAKKVIAPSTIAVKQNDPSSSCTITQTVKKGTQRVAHIPSEKFIDRPGVLEPLGSKIAANIRSTYLNMMIDHCLKIYLLPTDAYARAQHEELATSKKCSTVQIYKNSAVLAISRLKKEVLECNGVKKSGSDCAALYKVPQGAISKSNTVGSWSIESKIRRNFEDPQQFTGAKFYNNIQKWILTEEQLKENGFPRPHSSGEKGRAIIYGQNKKPPPKGYIRTCCRCKKTYTVDKKGFPTFKEDCIYHPNNKYRVRGEVRYQCCSQDGSSDGCCIASSHVYEYVDFENLKGYVKTLPPDSVMEDYGIYSLDCEMCYTTQGLDLTRVTVINSACKVVYETLVKPLHPIIDYNTRYSGITEEQMSVVKTTLLDVQATLLTMFNSKTILIGHSLESDFKALKLIHNTVIDTSVLYPHKMGPPYKRALRNLSSEYLKKIIQNSVDGHDSAEDATVCMELLIYKVKEDLKTR